MAASFGIPLLNTGPLDWWQLGNAKYQRVLCLEGYYHQIYPCSRRFLGQLPCIYPLLMMFSTLFSILSFKVLINQRVGLHCLHPWWLTKAPHLCTASTKCCHILPPPSTDPLFRILGGTILILHLYPRILLDIFITYILMQGLIFPPLSDIDYEPHSISASVMMLFAMLMAAEEVFDHGVWPLLDAF